MRLDLLLKGRTPGLELPRALLRSLAAAIGLVSFFQSSRAGLIGNLEGRLSLRVLEVAMITAKVDGQAQLAPLLYQPKTFGLKTRVDASKLFTKAVHRAHRLLEELVADHAAPVLKLERSPDLVLRLRGCGWSIKWRAVS